MTAALDIAKSGLLLPIRTPANVRTYEETSRAEGLTCR
jgi:hypothetical protein